MSLTDTPLTESTSSSDGTVSAAGPGSGEDGRRDESGAAVSGRRPMFSITDAAVACAVSRKTITRKLPELATHGAAKDEDGVWQIPVEALLALGLHPGRSVAGSARQPRTGTVDLRQDSSAPPAPEPRGSEMVTIPRDRWDDVRIRLARAEAEASERALALADARLALRALTAGPSTTAATARLAPSAAIGAEGPGDREVNVLPSASRSPAAGSSTPAAGVVGEGSGVTGFSGTYDADLDLFSARSHVARNGLASAAAEVAGPALRRRWWRAR